MPFKLFSKTLINITLSGSKGSSTTYSTLDAIKGTADISVKSNTSFTDIEVALVGSVTTRVDAAGRSGALVGGESQATQQFLKLTQPLDFEQLGLTDNVLRTGEYKVPFTFVVPSHLLPRACSHRSSTATREAHLKLPPTMGNKKPISGFITPTDFAPEEVKIEYSISVNLLDSQRNLGKASKKIHIIPAVDEEPPVSSEEIPEQFILRKEKSVRKKLLGCKIGHLAASATEPSSFKLPATDSVDYDPTTFARISLRFDPANANDAPPSLSSLSSKLMINTAWATTPRMDLQYKGFFGNRSDFRDMTTDALTDEVSLSPLTLSSTMSQWTQHSPFDPRASIVSTSTVDTFKKDEIISPTKSSNPSLPFYTTTLTLPLTLPSGKNIWLPTFHSCLVSRTYALSLSLHFSAGSSSSKVELVVPVQLSKKHTVRGQAALELADAQTQAAVEAEEAFIARSTLAVPNTPTDIMRVGFPSVIGPSSIGLSQDAPPTYVDGAWNGRVMNDVRSWSRF